MRNLPANSTNLRLVSPEVVFLESEDIEVAKNMTFFAGEAKWETYLNALALVGLQQWLRERMPDKIINIDSNVIKVADFVFFTIVTENLLDEVVNLPINILDNPEHPAHFYVVIEVLEEEEEVIIRGFLRHDELINYRSLGKLQLRDNFYSIPLSLFDLEPNHLLFYSRFVEATAIKLPVAASAANLLESFQQTPTKLSQWLHGVVDESWQIIEALISPELNLALSTRNLDSGKKRGKLIDLGMQLNNQTVALLVNITQDAEDKLGILIQLHPTAKEKYLPQNLKLSLLSKVGKTLQEVSSRIEDNYIQLKPFKGELGKRFSIEVSLGDVSLRENFEL